MPRLFLAKHKFILFICLAGVFSFCSVFQTQAYLAPGIYVTELKVSEIKSNVIRGEFSVSNSERYYLNDLNYEIKLFQGVSFKELKLIDVNVPEETFFVPPGQTITKSFAYTYPKNIISGDYTLRAQIITERGSELGWKDEKVSLEGRNKFLDILDIFSRVLVRGEEAFSLAGINVSSEEDVVAFLKVENPGEAITVIPRIKIFERQLNMSLIREYQESSITFAKDETKEISLAMPKLDIPESYLAEVKFYQGKEQVSGIQYFRWVVKGEGGKILYVKADKDYYRAGENIEITIDLIGPADLSDIGEGKLEVTIFDKDGNLVVKTTKDVTLNSDLFSLVITIPVEKDLISPVIEVKLIKGENVLDERSIKLSVFSQEIKELERKKTKTYLTYLLSSIALILALIAGFLLYKFKIKKKE